MPTLSTVAVGTRLVERTHEPSMVSLFLYNAAIWNAQASPDRLPRARQLDEDVFQIGLPRGDILYRVAMRLDDR